MDIDVTPNFTVRPLPSKAEQVERDLAVGAQRGQIPRVALAMPASRDSAAREADTSRAAAQTVAGTRWIPIVVGLLVGVGIGSIPFLFAWVVLARHG